MTAFICSPYRSQHKDPELKAKESIKYHHYTCECCRVVAKAQHIVIVPHLYYPLFLDDTDDIERDLEISSSIKLLEICDCIVVNKKYGVSERMTKEIKRAKELHMMILEAYSTEQLEELMKYHRCD